ncbi:MAG: beta-propeller domain-containing protein, partial [Gammaproteobacteria bacterium]|nr:beta-propeller domain-containing protein [Gammaproteobacteria bacterium]
SNAGFAHSTSSFIFIAGSNNAGNGTTVTLVDVSDPGGAIALRGSIDLPGYVSDDQKLNFAGGVLRIVTHDWTDRGLSRLFTIEVTNPDAPAVMASLNLARGEQLFATQFTADRAYLVTFERVDPLWVIDLSNPAQPTIAGELEVPGWSTQMVADGDQLVTIGVDPARGWLSNVSLFDVSNPAAPALLDREDVGDGSITALWERKAFGVFPGLVLVPRWDGLAVVERGAATLTLRGVIDVAGGALRGFPYGTGIAAAGAEEVVMADAATLDVTGRVTIAENVVDIGRLGDGTLLRLVQAGNTARLGGAEVELWAEAYYPFGQSAAVVGWDAAGRAAYVLDFSVSPAAVSARLELGSGVVTPVGAAGEGATAPDLAGGGAAFIAPIYSGTQAVLTASGKLVLRGLPGGNPYVFGDGVPTDGVIVIDIPAAGLGKGVAVRDAAITGIVADGAVLAFSYARFAGVDPLDRPLLEHDYVRIDLDGDVVTPAVNVPGYVVAATGPELYTIEESWGDAWSVARTVVAARTRGGGVEVLDRLVLPDGAYDLRAAGRTLFFSAGGGIVVPLLDGLDRPVPWLPQLDIGTVRLGAALARGPAISGTGSFRTLLLPEDGAALVSRDGLTVERWDVAGVAADLSWSVALPAYPLRAHADTVNPGKYLVALGYAGDSMLP